MDERLYARAREHSAQRYARAMTWNSSDPSITVEADRGRVAAIGGSVASTGCATDGELTAKTTVAVSKTEPKLVGKIAGSRTFRRPGHPERSKGPSSNES